MTTMLYRCLLLLLVACTVANTNNDNDALLEWVRSQGGYFHPKLELRYGDGLFGVFASQDIKQDEILASIPWNCIIHTETFGRFENCDVVELLAEQLESPNKSPYVASLQHAAQEHTSLLPTNWSPQGQELLLEVTGNGILPPNDPLMTEFEWKHKCERVHKNAALLVMTHGEDIGMVPLTDKFNSRGGNYTGAYFSIVDGDDVGLEIKALRNLKAGEQVYTNYQDYGQVGTPELLRDYGFVEMYPQRWIFHDQGIAFDVEETETGVLEIKWVKKIFNKKYRLPNKEIITFLQEELVRLEGIYSELQRKEMKVPENELRTITQFCRDYTTAIARAIEDATGCPAEGECIEAFMS